MKGRRHNGAAARALPATGEAEGAVVAAELAGTLPELSPPAEALLSAKQLAWLMMRTPDELEPEEQRFLQRIRQNATVEQVYGLARQFVEMGQGRLAEQLDTWLEASKTSGVAVFKEFGAVLGKVPGE